MKLITELQKIEEDYQTSTIDITDGLPYSQKETLRTAEFYSASSYTKGGDFYPNGRRKPFYNIVNAMVDTAIVATDIDTKDIRVEAESADDYDKSFVYNHEIQKWMKDANFALTLNKMGETRPRYGGVLIKRCVDEEGEMYIDVPEWKNLCTDPVDIMNGVIIEKHYMTPNELRKKDVWNNTDEAIKLYAKKGYTRTDSRVEIWEIHGEFSKSYLSDEAEFNEDEDYSLQRHIYAVKGDKAVHLFWEEIKEIPYMYLPWKRVAGRALGRGVIEEGKQAQVWTNDAIQKEQQATELASKTIVVTTDKKFGDNVLSDVDNGGIMQKTQNTEVEVLNLLNPNILTQLQNNVDKWWTQYERATSSYDATRGETPPSGQPYRLQALVAQQANSSFDYRREEWGIFLTEVFNKWVFKEIEKKLNKKHLLASEFTPEELVRLDEKYALYEANAKAKEKILNGEVISQEQYMQMQSEFKQLIGQSGKRRFLDIPEGYYKDMDCRLTINITGEQKNKMAALESLNSMLQQMLPLVQMGVITAEDIKLVVNKIMELSGAGISPLSLSKDSGQLPQQGQQLLAQAQPQPQQGQLQ